MTGKEKVVKEAVKKTVSPAIVNDKESFEIRLKEVREAQKEFAKMNQEEKHILITIKCVHSHSVISLVHFSMRFL